MRPFHNNMSEDRQWLLLLNSSTSGCKFFSTPEERSSVGDDLRCTLTVPRSVGAQRDVTSTPSCLGRDTSVPLDTYRSRCHCGFVWGLQQLWGCGGKRFWPASQQWLKIFSRHRCYCSLSTSFSNLLLWTFIRWPQILNQWHFLWHLALTNSNSLFNQDFFDNFQVKQPTTIVGGFLPKLKRKFSSHRNLCSFVYP